MAEGGRVIVPGHGRGGGPVPWPAFALTAGGEGDFRGLSQGVGVSPWLDACRPLWDPGVACACTLAICNHCMMTAMGSLMAGSASSPKTIANTAVVDCPAISMPAVLTTVVLTTWVAFLPNPAATLP